MYCADPIEDFHYYDRNLEDTLENLPICCECGEAIQQDTAVKIGSDWYCDECLSSFRKSVDF